MIKRPRRTRSRHLVPGILVATLLLVCVSLTLWPKAAQAIPPAQQTPTLPFVQFVNSVYTVDEDRGPAQISVSVNATPVAGQNVVVEYLTLPGTAIEGPGGDFIRATGELTFSSTSDNVQTFNVTINDDSIVNEPDKTVNLILRLKTPATATLGRAEAVLIIRDDDFATATPPPQQATVTPIFVDALEPNNTFDEAATIAAGATATCQLTLWPPGDLDYYGFAAKSGTFYRVQTEQLTPGLDTVLKVYDPTGNVIAENDDVGGVGQFQSEVAFRAGASGIFFARVVNKSPSDPAGRTYCFRIDAIDQPTPTVTPTLLPTRAGSDSCEPNGQLQLACLFGENQSQEFNFVPPFNEGPDNDFYQVWVKPGISYTCETTNLSDVTDTNMIFLDNNGGDFNPPLGNDDKAPGDLGSRLTYVSTYTGWLYILVGPVNPVPLADASRFTYTLVCTSTAATPTPTVAPVVQPPGGGVILPPAQPSPTPFPTPTPIDLSFLLSPTPMVPPVVTIQPLPTSTPPTGGQGTVTVNVTVYYDSNFNFMPELTEGIVDVAVALYDNSNGRLLAFGYTNQSGVVRFEQIPSSGAVRVEVPLLNYTQIVTGDAADIMIRVAPLPLPIGIP